MNNKALKHLLFVAISLIPLAYLAIIWKQIPGTVPTHFGANMKPDDYSSRWGFFGAEAFMSLISIGVYFLLQYIHKIDPKRANKPQSPVFDKLSMGLVIFMVALGFVTINMSLGKTIASGRWMFTLIGLMFAFMGNLMHNVKPNYFVGLRLPWTLNSDYNWRKTHQLAAKVWFAGGLLVAALSFFLPMESSAIAMIIISIILVLIPVTYSFRLFKKEQNDPSIANEENNAK
jgi:uncharacterized membrane protein